MDEQNYTYIIYPLFFRYGISFLKKYAGYKLHTLIKRHSIIIKHKFNE